MRGKLGSSWNCWVWSLIQRCLKLSKILDLGWGKNWKFSLANPSFNCLSIHFRILLLCPTNLYGKLVSLRRWKFVLGWPLGRESTRDILQKRRPNLAISPSWCILCKQKGENIDHIILHCNYSSYMWNKVGEEFGIIGAKPNSWHVLLGMEWQFIGNNKKSKLLWRCCLALSWCIWQERH